MNPGRYRCHAAKIGSRLIAPAIVTVSQNGSIDIAPYTHEVMATVDLDGVLLVVPEDCSSPLPDAIPLRGAHEFLRALDLPDPSGGKAVPLLLPFRL
ncbi:MAG: hypothetical protein NC339_03020 [Muribaculaceae bacterium]|nr:hypothetical protein [Muribaculaceae bacterium]